MKEKLLKLFTRSTAKKITHLEQMKEMAICIEELIERDLVRSKEIAEIKESLQILDLESRGLVEDIQSLRGGLNALMEACTELLNTFQQQSAKIDQNHETIAKVMKTVMTAGLLNITPENVEIH